MVKGRRFGGGRLTKLALVRKEKARGQRSTTIADQTQLDLALRGLFVPSRELGERSFNDCVDAQGWARNMRPTAMLPAWLSSLIADKLAIHMGGWCRECGRSGPELRRSSVGWADKTDTLCASCSPGGGK